MEKVVRVHTERMGGWEVDQLGQLVAALKAELRPGVNVYEDWVTFEATQDANGEWQSVPKWGTDDADVTFFIITDATLTPEEVRARCQAEENLDEGVE